jgi:hypothetical protein
MIKHRQNQRLILHALVLTFFVALANASPGITKVDMAAAGYFQVSVLSNAPAPQKVTQSGPGGHSFKVPSLEIFDPQGIAVFYNDDTPTIIKTLGSLHANLAAMKPIEGYVPLAQLLGQLGKAGAANLEGVGKKKVYTFVLVGLYGDQCKPCKDVDGAMAAFVKESAGADYEVLELTLHTY